MERKGAASVAAYASPPVPSRLSLLRLSLDEHDGSITNSGERTREAPPRLVVTLAVPDPGEHRPPVGHASGAAGDVGTTVAVVSALDRRHSNSTTDAPVSRLGVLYLPVTRLMRHGLVVERRRSYTHLLMAVRIWQTRRRRARSVRAAWRGVRDVPAGASGFLRPRGARVALLREQAHRRAWRRLVCSSIRHQ